MQHSAAELETSCQAATQAENEELFHNNMIDWRMSPKEFGDAFRFKYRDVNDTI